MKYLWRIAFLGVMLVPMLVRAEVTIVKKQTATLRAFQNLDSRLANLENYSVVYFANKQKTKYVVMRSAPARQTHKGMDKLSVVLRPAKKKS